MIFEELNIKELNIQDKEQVKEYTTKNNFIAFVKITKIFIKVEDKSDYLGSTSVETRSPSHRFSVGG